MGFTFSDRMVIFVESWAPAVVAPGSDLTAIQPQWRRTRRDVQSRRRNCFDAPPANRTPPLSAT